MKLGTKFSQLANVVYSTEHGSMCALCGQPQAKCVCKIIKKNFIPSTDGIVRVSRDSKNRHGKSVSVITGLALNETQLKELATQLKKKCGTGGTVKERTIEIQGDHRTLLVAELTKLGYTAKLAGG